MLDKRISPVYKNKLDFVEENLKKTDGKVLDIGCGGGHYFHAFKQKQLSFVGVDIDHAVLDRSEHVLCASVEKLPFRSAMFDTVVCIDVMEHVADDQQAMKEVHRVLKHGGKLILTVPNKQYPFVYDPINTLLGMVGMKLPIGMWAWGHRRLYTKRDIRTLLTTHSFRIIRYERRSFFLVGLLVNYLPWLAEYIMLPILRLLRPKKAVRFMVKPGIEKNVIYRFYQWINRLDKAYFSGSYRSINHCLVCVKALRRSA